MISDRFAHLRKQEWPPPDPEKVRRGRIDGIFGPVCFVYWGEGLERRQALAPVGFPEEEQTSE